MPDGKPDRKPGPATPLMQLADARALAAALMEEMRPACHRVEVAGSVRRGKAEVKDLELVAIPAWEEILDPGDLFGERVTRRNRLHQWALSTQLVRWLKPGAPDRVPWPPKEDGRYWRGEVVGSENGAALDLFLTVPERWGIIYLIRSGPAEFSQAVVTHALRVGRPCRDGALTEGGLPIVTIDERSAFAALGLHYVPPEERVDRSSLRYQRRA